MTDAEDRFLDAMISGARDVQTDMSDKFEQQCVQHVLTQLGLGPRIAALRAERARVTGVRDLDFLWFYGAFPSCPVQFGTARVAHQLARKRWPKDWFMPTTKSPILTVYNELRTAMQESGVDTSIGMIFLWPGWQTKLLLHNWRYRRPRDSGYWAYAGNVWLEPLDTVLSAIRADWQPEV